MVDNGDHATSAVACTRDCASDAVTESADEIAWQQAVAERDELADHEAAAEQLAHKYMSVLTKRDLEDWEINDHYTYSRDEGCCAIALAIQATGRRLYKNRADAMLSGAWDTIVVRAARYNRVKTMFALEQSGLAEEDCVSGTGEWPLFVACLHGQVRTIARWSRPPHKVHSEGATIPHSLHTPDHRQVEMAKHILGGMFCDNDYEYTDLNQINRSHPIYDHPQRDTHTDDFFAGASALDMLCILPGTELKQASKLMSRKLEIARHFFEEYSCKCNDEPFGPWLADTGASLRCICGGMLRYLCASRTIEQWDVHVLEMARLLLEHGADPNLMVGGGRGRHGKWSCILFQACSYAHERAQEMADWSWTAPGYEERW